MIHKDITIRREQVLQWKPDSLFNPISTREVLQLLDEAEKADEYRDALKDLYEAVTGKGEFGTAIAKADYILSGSHDKLIEIHMLRESNRKMAEESKRLRLGMCNLIFLRIERRNGMAVHSFKNNDGEYLRCSCGHMFFDKNEDGTYTCRNCGAAYEIT